jgi:hypothetical protein
VADDNDDEKVVPFQAPNQSSLTGAELTEAFLQRNATPEYIAHQLSDMLRHLMRAISVKTNYSINLYEALGLWKFLLELVERCKEPLSWHHVFDEAIKKLRDDGAPETGDLDEAYREVARSGMSLYIDGMGEGGFGSVKHSRFMDALRHLEEHRNLRRKERERERVLGQETIAWKGKSENGDEVIFHIAPGNCLVMVTQVSEVRGGKVVRYRARKTHGCSIACAPLSQEDAKSLAELLLTKYTESNSRQP